MGDLGGLSLYPGVGQSLLGRHTLRRFQLHELGDKVLGKKLNALFFQI